MNTGIKSDPSVKNPLEALNVRARQDSFVKKKNNFRGINSWMAEQNYGCFNTHKTLQMSWNCSSLLQKEKKPVLIAAEGE